MSVKVKKKLCFFSAFIPVRIKINNESAGILYGSQELTIPMQENEGELKYYQPLGRNDQVYVKNGDVVEVSEILHGKVFSILFVLLMIYLLTRSIGNLSFASFFNYEEILLYEQIAFGVLMFCGLVGMFFKTHKLKVLSRSSS